jgi:bifunctional non-homologous end joining protein LigD
MTRSARAATTPGAFCFQVPRPTFRRMLRTGILRPAGLIEPCLPTRAVTPPAGPGWLHEIKHDGFRLMVLRETGRVRVYTRHGNDWSTRYPLIINALWSLRCRSCVIDGEVVVPDGHGLSNFELLRSRRHDHRAFLYAFDLLELDGRDLRGDPIEARKHALSSLLEGAGHGLQLVEHIAEDGAAVFKHACLLGLEGIVSKRKGSKYRGGRSEGWIKSKNPGSPAVTREATEEWGKPRTRVRELAP